MLWPPPLARVSEVPVPRHGRSPLGGHLATIATLTLHAIDDGLSHAACGSVPLAAVQFGVSRAQPAPARCVPGALQGGFTSAVPSQS